MSKFTDQIDITIGSFEKNVIYYDLQLSQKMADHHYFSFVWQYTGKAIIDPEDQAKAITKYIGSEVIFTFKVNGIKLMSKGIINGLKSVDLHGSPAGLHVTGISHTAALDDIEKSRIFLGKNLKDIALEIFVEEKTGEFYQREAVKPTHNQVFLYKPQYNETSFHFMKRLSMRYGQWFYFDGMRMQFGQTKASKIKLINGSSLHEFTIQANLISHKTSYDGYDYNAARNVKNASQKTETGSKDRFAVSMGFNQGALVRKDLNEGAYTNNAQDKEEIDEMVSLQTAGRDANSVFYSGISYLPIGVGQVFTIQNKTVEHELIAVEVLHQSEVNGNYSCTFKAIPADVAAPHYTNVKEFAIADTQPAEVIDNNDPEKLGRVKVQFNWTGWDTQSYWIRMIQPHSGANKGFHFIPEIGEEVLVGFEGGNVECPYIIGSHYNGRAISGYSTEQNDIKAIHTRSGTKIIFNDAQKSVLIEDPSGNKYFMDGKGNTTVTAPKNMTFNVGEDLTINVGNDMFTTVKMNSTENVGVNKSTTVGLQHSTAIGGNSILDVKGNFSENIKGNLESNTEQDRKEITLKGYQLDSTNNIHVKSANDLHVKKS